MDNSTANRGTSIRDLIGPVTEQIPAGHWMSYGDLAAQIDSHPRPVSRCMARNVMPNAHRILRANGSVSPGFRWVDGRSDDPVDVLRAEGLTFTDGRADPDRRWRP
jgi:O6-methylguanine-DNA--protein-cysteine methyltransferase